jgi:hypothetical protein
VTVDTPAKSTEELKRVLLEKTSRAANNFKNFKTRYPASALDHPTTLAQQTTAVAHLHPLLKDVHKGLKHVLLTPEIAGNNAALPHNMSHDDELTV